MKYLKPEAQPVGSVLAAVQNTILTKAAGPYTDSENGAAFDNTQPQPAYQADE
jgi:hypothetical protein